MNSQDLFKPYRHLLIGFVLIICGFSDILAAESIATIQQQQLTLNKDNGQPGIQLLAIATLSNISVNGFKASELSGLAWDEDEKILYAVSDKGYLLHLRPLFTDLHLTNILLLDGYALHDENGKPLKWKASDSEGLSVQCANNGISGDTQLLVSFERHPRIIKYTPNGKFIEKIGLPPILQDISNYQSENKSLESITIHPGLGLLTGAEYPVNGEPHDSLKIYSMNGKSWSIPAAHQNNGGLSDMSTFANGDLLILERRYSGLWPAFSIALRRVSFKDDTFSNETIARFSPDQDLFNDNFEGITRHKDNYFFMVSDDNNHPFKRTLLIYFKIIE